MPEGETDPARLLSARVAWALDQRAALRAAIERTRDARSLTFADDEHDPDGSTASLDQARDAALLARTEQLLTDLEEAQQRLASGGYGRCEVCGQEIPAERLQARPETVTCIRCAQHPRRRRSH